MKVRQNHGIRKGGRIKDHRQTSPEVWSSNHKGKVDKIARDM